MSFEGHYQFICKHGHQFIGDYEYGDFTLDNYTCPNCCELAVWENLVDDTNCDEFGKVPLSDFYKGEDTMGFSTYDIPMEFGNMIDHGWLLREIKEVEEYYRKQREGKAE